MSKSFRDQLLEEFFDKNIDDIQSRFGRFLQNDFMTTVEDFKKFYTNKLDNMGDKAKHIDFNYIIDDIIKECHSIRDLLMKSHTNMLLESSSKVQNDTRFREAVGAVPAFSLTK